MAARPRPMSGNSGWKFSARKWVTRRASTGFLENPAPVALQSATILLVWSHYWSSSAAFRPEAALEGFEEPVRLYELRWREEG